MRHRVTFMERTGGDGKQAEFPPGHIEIDIVVCRVLDKVFIDRDRLAAMLVQGTRKWR